MSDPYENWINQHLANQHGANQHGANQYEANQQGNSSEASISGPSYEDVWNSFSLSEDINTSSTSRGRNTQSNNWDRHGCTGGRKGTRGFRRQD